MSFVLQDGVVADRARANVALTELSNQGTAVIADLSSAFVNQIFDLNRALSSVNARRTRANRSATFRTLARLDLTDFSDVDQSRTTATVRIDLGTANLKERNLPQAASILTTGFTSNAGTVNAFGKMYQVYMADTPGTPVGTFLITLTASVYASMILFDIVAMPSNPSIQVSVSADGTTFTDATTVDLQGYRVKANLAPGSVKFVKLVLAPSHGDDIDGSTFTFGVTDVSLAAVQFQLASELSTSPNRPILITPSSATFLFVADADPGVLFYLAIDGAPFVQVASGDVVKLANAAETVLPGVGSSAGSPGVLTALLPANCYPNSVSVIDNATRIKVPLLQNLDPYSASASSLFQQYVAVWQSTLNLVPRSAADAARTFTISYTSGPQSISVQVRVLFTTSDRSLTPAFRGATFQEI